MHISEQLRAVLDEQHHMIELKLRTVTDASGVERQLAFDDLRRYLAAHQAAEQFCDSEEPEAAPAQTLTDPSGYPTQSADLIDQLEDTSIDSPAFDETFGVLAGQVNQHLSTVQAQPVSDVPASESDDDSRRTLRAFQAVPLMSTGNGRSILMATTFTFHELREGAKAEFRSIPPGIQVEPDGGSVESDGDSGHGEGEGEGSTDK